jgi:hypothetical protein
LISVERERKEKRRKEEVAEP